MRAQGDAAQGDGAAQGDAAQKGRRSGQDAVQAHPGQAAVGVDVERARGDAAGVPEAEAVRGVGLQPGPAAAAPSSRSPSSPVSATQPGALCSRFVVSISASRTRPRPASRITSQSLPAVAAARGLPALGLVAGQAGRQDVVGRGVELVGAGGDQRRRSPAPPGRGRARRTRQVRPRLAVHPQPGDAAVGEDVQPHVGVAAARRRPRTRARRRRSARSSARSPSSRPPPARPADGWPSTAHASTEAYGG